MDSQQIVDLIKILSENNLLSDTHVFMILGLISIVFFKKITTPLRQILESLAKKSDVETILAKFNKISSELETINRKLDEILAKANLNENEIILLKRDIEQVKKYLENFYLLNANKK